MKIVATTRTRNEEANIERFCLTYGTFCNEIIIVDGGSDDDTVEIARSMPNTTVYDFHERVEGKNGLWRNPHGRHINTCITWAIRHGADWVIFDDCDDVPTLDLQRNARDLFEETEAGAVMAHRLYVYKDNQYFPDMNKPGQSLWAWNVNSISLWADEDDPWKHHISYPPKSKSVFLKKPYSLLHFFAPDEETIKRKLDFYVESGQHPEMKLPEEVCGRLEELPEWARWR